MFRQPKDQRIAAAVGKVQASEAAEPDMAKAPLQEMLDRQAHDRIMVAVEHGKTGNVEPATQIDRGEAPMLQKSGESGIFNSRDDAIGGQPLHPRRYPFGQPTFDMEA